MFGLALKKTVRVLEESNSEYVQKIADLEAEVTILNKRKSASLEANEALAALSKRYDELMGQSA